MDVSDKECEQELSKLTPDVNQNCENCRFATIKIKTVVPYEKCYDLFLEWCKKNGTVRISENVIFVYLSQQSP
jgi:hypothetical protein